MNTIQVPSTFLDSAFSRTLTFAAYPSPPLAPRLLILQLKRIGDAILTAPALGALRASLPDAHLTLMLAGPAAQLGRGFGMVDEVLTYGAGSSTRCWRKALFSKYDAVLDFSGTDRSAALALATRAAVRTGYEKDGKNWLRRKAYTHLSDASVRELHTIDFHHALVTTGLKALGISNGSSVADAGHLKIPPDLAPAGLPEPYVVVHPGTAREEKYWPSERWIEVIQHVGENYQLPVIVTGASDPREILHIQEIEAATNLHANYAGQLTLLQLSSVLSNARLVLGVDSAAMHLAAAFQRPQVALFGPTNPFHWHPRHPQAITLTAGVPSGPPLTPRHPKNPMTDLSHARVIEAVDSLLSSPKTGV